MTPKDKETNIYKSRYGRSTPPEPKPKKTKTTKPKKAESTDKEVTD